MLLSKDQEFCKKVKEVKYNLPTWKKFNEYYLLLEIAESYSEQLYCLETILEDLSNIDHYDLQKLYLISYKLKSTPRQQSVQHKIESRIIKMLDSMELGTQRSRYNYYIHLEPRFHQNYKPNVADFIKRFKSIGLVASWFGKSQEQCFQSVLLTLMESSLSNDKIIDLFDHSKDSLSHILLKTFVRIFEKRNMIEQLKQCVTIELPGGSDRTNSQRIRAYKYLIRKLSYNEICEFTKSVWSSKYWSTKSAEVFLKLQHSQETRKQFSELPAKKIIRELFK